MAESMALHRKCIELVPDNLMYRLALHGAARKLAEDRALSKRLLAWISGWRLGRKSQHAFRRHNWQSARDFAVDGLLHRPGDLQLNVLAARASRRLGYAEIALYYARCAVAADPLDLNVRLLVEELESSTDDVE